MPNSRATNIPLILTIPFCFFICLFAACGSDGDSCVVESSTGRSGWETCYDDYNTADCDEKKETLDVDVQHSSSTCESRGFTKKCSGEYGFRLSAYSC